MSPPEPPPPPIPTDGPWAITCLLNEGLSGQWGGHYKTETSGLGLVNFNGYYCFYTSGQNKRPYYCKQEKHRVYVVSSKHNKNYN